MILEAAYLHVVAGRQDSFEQAFRQASPLLAAMRGHLTHSLQRCIEQPDRYLLLVEWERLEDHTEGFRRSRQYEEWKRLLHPFYDPFPTVEHFAPIDLTPPDEMS